VGIEEAVQQNSFYDAVQQFRVVSELQIFDNTPFIVFFNKYDLLPEKVKRSPLSKVRTVFLLWLNVSQTFKDYTAWADANAKPDDSDVENAIAYFSGMSLFILYLIYIRRNEKTFQGFDPRVLYHVCSG
jgi:hypothetical protein